MDVDRLWKRLHSQECRRVWHNKYRRPFQEVSCEGELKEEAQWLETDLGSKKKNFKVEYIWSCFCVDGKDSTEGEKKKTKWIIDSVNILAKSPAEEMQIR